MLRQKVQRDVAYHAAWLVLLLSVVFQPSCGIINKILGKNNDKSSDSHFPATSTQTLQSPDGGTPIQVTVTYNSGLALNNAPPSAVINDTTFYNYVPSVTGSGLKWAVSANAALPAGLSLDPGTGTLSGCVGEASGSVPVSITGTDAKGNQITIAYTLNVAGDPLAQFAWHLDNHGQSTFSADVPQASPTPNPYFGVGAAVAGNDLNVRAVLCSGITGKHVRVAVSDIGVEIAHEDLKANITPNQSRDYSKQPPPSNDHPYEGGDPTPPAPTSLGSLGGQPDDNAHGTAVSGLIAAVMGNGVGSHGLAPNANIVGFNYLGSSSAFVDPTNNPDGLFQVLTGVQIDQATSYENRTNGPIDIFNYSYGGQDLFYPSEPANYIPQLQNGTQKYRGGKGAIYVKAAGNGFFMLAGTNQAGKKIYLSQSANGDQENANPYTLVVAATNAEGFRSSYSSTGSAIWISGLGGEFGDSGKFGEPAMLTTDTTGCDRGFSNSGLTSPANDFEYSTSKSSNNAKYNSNCNYTTIMNGTSSATPSIVSVVALMLEANPGLVWRDVFDILAKTATQIHANLKNISLTFDPTNLPAPNQNTWEPGWFTNAAGFHYQNWYGFGRADAKAAVAMAKTYTPSASSTLQMSSVTTGTINVVIPDKSATGVTQSLPNVNISGNPKIFTVLLHISSTHPMPSELSIQLTSPSGTVSYVLTSYNSFVGVSADGNTLGTGTTLTNAIFRSNAFYGESPNGVWKVKIQDVDNMFPVPAGANNPCPTAANGNNCGNLTSATLDLYY